VTPPTGQRPSLSGPVYARLALGGAAAVGLGLWYLWHLAGVPSAAAQPGAADRAPDPQAWRWLVSVWLPVAFAAFASSTAD